MIGLKKRMNKNDKVEYCDAEALTQPAFLLGKLLDVMLLDPIENELRQLEIINALLAGGKDTFGEDFIERIAPTLRAVRGVGYQPVDFFMQRPSDDIGRIAAECYHRSDADGGCARHARRADQAHGDDGRAQGRGRLPVVHLLRQRIHRPPRRARPRGRQSLGRPHPRAARSPTRPADGPDARASTRPTSNTSPTRIRCSRRSARAAPCSGSRAASG